MTIVTLHGLFWLGLFIGLLLLWGVVEGIGWCIDAVADQVNALRGWWRQLFKGGSFGYSDPGLRHREIHGELVRLEARPTTHAAAIGGSRQRGLDVAESLPHHPARRSGAGPRLVGSVPRDLSAFTQRSDGGHDDRLAGYGAGTTLTAADGAPARVNGRRPHLWKH